jgi:hypothetical protein
MFTPIVYRVRVRNFFTTGGTEEQRGKLKKFLCGPL